MIADPKSFIITGSQENVSEGIKKNTQPTMKRKRVASAATGDKTSDLPISSLGAAKISFVADKEN